jgi:hypothetical protein
MSRSGSPRRQKSKTRSRSAKEEESSSKSIVESKHEEKKMKSSSAVSMPFKEMVSFPAFMKEYIEKERRRASKKGTKFVRPSTKDMFIKYKKYEQRFIADRKKKQKGKSASETKKSRSAKSNTRSVKRAKPRQKARPKLKSRSKTASKSSFSVYEGSATIDPNDLGIDPITQDTIEPRNLIRLRLRPKRKGAKGTMQNYDVVSLYQYLLTTRNEDPAGTRKKFSQYQLNRIVDLYKRATGKQNVQPLQEEKKNPMTFAEQRDQMGLPLVDIVEEYSLNQLLGAGYSGARIVQAHRDNGTNAQELAELGFEAGEIIDVLGVEGLDEIVSFVPYRDIIQIVDMDNRRMFSDEMITRALGESELEPTFAVELGYPYPVMAAAHDRSGARVFPDQDIAYATAQTRLGSISMMRLGYPTAVINMVGMFRRNQRQRQNQPRASRSPSRPSSRPSRSRSRSPRPSARRALNFDDDDEPVDRVLDFDLSPEL